MPTGARTMTVVRQKRVDPLATVTAPDAATNTVIDGVIVLPSQTYETGQGWITIDGRDIYILPSSRVIEEGGTRPFADTDLDSSDHVLLDGDDTPWQVEGGLAPFDKGAERKATKVSLRRERSTP